MEQQQQNQQTQTYKFGSTTWSSSVVEDKVVTTIKEKGQPDFEVVKSATETTPAKENESWLQTFWFMVRQGTEDLAYKLGL